jgi:hypothetical protein
MKAALLSLALLGSSLAMPVSDRVPQLNVEALCKSTTETDKAMNLAEPQSLENCMRDETAARQQLDSVWQTTSVSVRDGCEGEAITGGFQSYVDLLTCIQMTGDSASSSPSAGLRGGSKNRNKN